MKCKVIFFLVLPTQFFELTFRGSSGAHIPSEKILLGSLRRVVFLIFKAVAIFAFLFYDSLGRSVGKWENVLVTIIT